MRTETEKNFSSIFWMLNDKSVLERTLLTFFYFNFSIKNASIWVVAASG